MLQNLSTQLKQNQAQMANISKFKWMGLGNLGNGAVVEQIGDFNNDGVDDLRIRVSNGAVGALLVNGANNLEWHYYGSLGKEWETSLAAVL